MVSTKARVSKIFPMKGLEFFLRYRDSAELFPILVPTKIDLSTKKQCRKWYTVWSSGASCLEMIFVLLAKVVAIYVWLSKIHVRNLNFQKLLAGDFCFWFLTFSLWKNLQDSFQYTWRSWLLLEQEHRPRWVRRWHFLGMQVCQTCYLT